MKTKLTKLERFTIWFIIAWFTILGLVVILISCDDFEPALNCECGVVVDKFPSGIYYFVGIENECTGVVKNKRYDKPIYDSLYLGQRYCY